MSHTKEPWIQIEGAVADKEGAIISDCSMFGLPAIEEANARRIVACVNACAGISTENLEDNVPVKELARRYNVVIKSRDELISLIKNDVYAITFQSMAQYRAALIASVKGGAQPATVDAESEAKTPEKTDALPICDDPATAHAVGRIFSANPAEI